MPQTTSSPMRGNSPDHRGSSAGRGQGIGRRLGRIGLALVLPVLLLAVWQYLAVRLDNPWLLPRVTAVLGRLLRPFDNVLETGSLAYNVAVSCVRVLFGFSLAALVGVPLGLVMGRIRLVRRTAGPFIEMFRPVCPIAWLPFAMVIFRTWTVVNVFGVRYSDTIFDAVQLGMLFILFYGAFFPIVINTLDGVLGVREVYIESARTLGASPGQMFRKVVLPAALPSVVTGLRLGLGVAWFVIVAAEMLPGSDAGIGYLMIYAYQLAEMDVLITGMLLIGVVGALLSWLVRYATRPLTRWQRRAG